MRHEKNMKLDRRAFLRVGVVSGALAGTACLADETAASLPPGFKPAAENEPAQAPKGPASRMLGRTGMRVNVIGIGTLQVTEEAVIQAAMEMGVNYIDTARVYLSGRSEETVGRAVKGRREKVFIATKTPPACASKEDIYKHVDASLKAMQLDYVDVIQLHVIEDRNKVMNAELREALLKVREQGKARFLGLTTHKNQVEVLNAVAEDPEHFFDVVLVAYNYQSPPEVGEAIARVAEKGVGVVAMKTQQGGYKTEELGNISPHQASLKWVLRNPHVACAVPGMVDIAQLREDVAVANMLELTRTEEQVLERYAEAVQSIHCLMCGSCDGTCPFGVRVSDVNRCLMYLRGYGDIVLARSAYAEIPAACSPDRCLECPGCQVRCVRGLPIADRMREARTLLA
ncbi:MAG TPA: aldo/keto reductase [Candidatus Hydrogenedentes bacterium]|nr:aldo/keto reductase [Candidatus Hydrogenedentota bacterium]